MGMGSQAELLARHLILRQWTTTRHLASQGTDFSLTAFLLLTTSCATQAIGTKDIGGKLRRARQTNSFAKQLRISVRRRKLVKLNWQAGLVGWRWAKSALK